jgi:hypothetical protein
VPTILRISRLLQTGGKEARAAYWQNIQIILEPLGAFVFHDDHRRASFPRRGTIKPQECRLRATEGAFSRSAERDLIPQCHILQLHSTAASGEVRLGEEPNRIPLSIALGPV